MDMHDLESDESFRRELLGWLAESLAAHGPLPSGDDREVRRNYDTGRQRKLDETGYAGINWSQQYRGRGAPLSEQLVCDEEDSEAIANIIAESRPGQFDGE